MKGRWRDHPARAELIQIYAEVDDLVRDCTCTCAAATGADDARCCQFGVTGREPYPTPVELCEVEHGRRASGAAPRTARPRVQLPLAEASCPLLSPEGRCSIYASRPFGCRTFFCRGHEPPRARRAAIQLLGRRLSDLAARYFPRDPLPRPFTRALAGSPPIVPPVPQPR